MDVSGAAYYIYNSTIYVDRKHGTNKNLVVAGCDLQQSDVHDGLASEKKYSYHE